MTVLGLGCYEGFFVVVSSVSSLVVCSGLLWWLVAEHGLYGVWASVVVAHELGSCGSLAQAQQLWHKALVAPWHV